MHRIVIVGGGAGGLELATYLGNQLGRRRRNSKADISLVDTQSTYLWKPLLHEIAAGSIDLSRNQLAYAAQAFWHGFSFYQGACIGLNRTMRSITISPVLDELGEECLPQRTLHYDTLVLAIGSITNFFNIPGAQENSFALDNASQAEHFRRRLISECQKMDQGLTKKPLHIVIVGAGATGVELAAELRNTAHDLSAYGLHNLDGQQSVAISLVEAASRILPALPERASQTTEKLLKKLSIDINANEAVSKIEKHRVHLKSGKSLEANLIVWAAGIKAPPILAKLDGLELNRNGQMLVHPTLQSVTDPNIFGLGDCTSCPWLGNEVNGQIQSVPPRAQAAHQQAGFLASAIKRHLKGQSLKNYKYRDLGSLISLGHFSAVGNLKGGTTKNFIIRGWIARIMYFSLYRMHLVALHGWVSMILDTLGHWFARSTRPRIKWH